MVEVGKEILISEQDIEDFLQEEIFDFRVFVKKFLWIKDEAGEIIRFELNELQEYVLQKLENKLLIPGEMIRLIILKCRQTGISTLIEAILFWISLVEMNQKMLIIGHEKESSINLFDMFQRYLEHLPTEDMKPSIETNQKERKIKYSIMKNEILVNTAGANVDTQKAGTGRSATYQYIHATECAFYPDYITTFVGLLQASKKAKMIILETTANGFNSFRDDWEDAKSGITDYIPIFLAWIDFKSYTKEFIDEKQKERLLKDLGANSRYNDFIGEEDQLIKFHKCTYEQLHWRRWAIDNLCKGNVQMFHQEYPTTDDEAFISSGKTFFPTAVCVANKKQSKEPLGIGDLVWRERGRKEKDVVFIPNRKGFFKFHTPIAVSKEEDYVFAAGEDVAEGLKQGDYSTIKVLDRRTMKVCISYRGHIDPDLFAHEHKKLQVFLKHKIWFNTEKNNHGLTTILEAHKLGVNQKYNQDFQKGYEVEDRHGLGFTTLKNSKVRVMNDLNEWIREGIFEDADEIFWNETLTFVSDDKGRLGAQNKLADPGVKCYDDEVIAQALMIDCHLWMPNYRRTSKKEDIGKNWKARKREKVDETTVMSV